MSESEIEELENQQFDPDPFGISIAVLGALGSAASIFTLVDEKRRRKARRRAVQERVEIYKLTSEVRSVVRELRGNYSYLLKRFMKDRDVDDVTLRGTIRFGDEKIILTPSTAVEYREVVGEIFDNLRTYHMAMIELSHKLYLFMDDFDIPPVQELMVLRSQADSILSPENTARESMMMTQDLLCRTEDALDSTFDWILHEH